MASFLFQFRVKDIDCAFKLMPTAMMRQADVRSRGAMFNTEFLAKFARMGVRITEVLVRHLPRQKSTATGANLTVIARAFRERFYEAVEALQVDLDRWLVCYNIERPHLGYRNQGKTPFRMCDLVS